MNTKYTAIFSIIASLLFSGCSLTPDRPPVAEELIWSTHKDRPAWTFEEPAQDDQTLTFVGMSNYHSTEKQSRETSKLNAMAKASEYLGAITEKHTEQTATANGSASSVHDEQITGSNTEKLRSKAVLKNAQIEDTYIELWQQSNGKRFYNSFVKIELPTKKAYTLVDDIVTQETKKPQQGTNTL